VSPFRVFEPAAEVVSGDEVGEVPAELIVAVVVEALDGGVLDGAVHPLDLTVGPGVLGLGGAVLDVVPGAGELESVGPEEFTVGDGLFDQWDGRSAIAGVVNWMPLSVSTVWIL
jgi:hypothetical protein